MFTLGIFKRECRSNPMFWRTLGFITDVIDDKSHQGRESTLKPQDYHNMLDIVLGSFKKAQKATTKLEIQ
jgi:hypothetical protein